MSATRVSRQLEIPDGTTFKIVEPATSGADEVVFEITMAPAATGPPRHVHPDQEEAWTVTEGELSIQVGSDWRTLRAGDSLAIAPGTVHTLKNRSPSTVRFLDSHVPALDFQAYIEDLDRLTRAGKLRRRITPRTAIYGATVLVRHRPMQLSASLAQRAAESVLTALGRALGYRVE